MKPEAFTPWSVVITADQRGSRRSADLVPEALDVLSHYPSSLGPERTAGDEIQILFRDAQPALEAVRHLVRLGQWRLGIGLGTVSTPLPGDIREARGAAFVAARSAIEAAHAQPSGMALATPSGFVGAARYRGDTTRDGMAREAWAVLVLLHQVWSRRSQEGWEVTERMRHASSAAQIAHDLGVSPSAVSQRLRAAGWQAASLGEDLLVVQLGRLMGCDAS